MSNSTAARPSPPSSVVMAAGPISSSLDTRHEYTRQVVRGEERPGHRETAVTGRSGYMFSAPAVIASRMRW